MEEFVADVTMIRFEIEDLLDAQEDTNDLVFPGMDKSNAAVCLSFAYTTKCIRGNVCPYRHIRDDRSVVCKHWLRGLCKKGDDCEFLHEFNMTKMPECYFFAKFGQCGNKECPFLHIDPDKKLKDCQWYDRGFCRHGPACKNRHARRMLCVNYTIGFCPYGKQCKHQHPSFDLPTISEPLRMDQQMPGHRSVVCYLCHQVGHVISACPNRSPSHMYSENDMAHRNRQHRNDYTYNKDLHPRVNRRSLSEVTCYKVGRQRCECICTRS